MKHKKFPFAPTQAKFEFDNQSPALSLFFGGVVFVWYVAIHFNKAATVEKIFTCVFTAFALVLASTLATMFVLSPLWHNLNFSVEENVWIWEIKPDGTARRAEPGEVFWGRWWKRLVELGPVIEREIMVSDPWNMKCVSKFSIRIEILPADQTMHNLYQSSAKAPEPTTETLDVFRLWLHGLQNATGSIETCRAYLNTAHQATLMTLPPFNIQVELPFRYTFTEQTKTYQT